MFWFRLLTLIFFQMETSSFCPTSRRMMRRSVPLAISTLSMRVGKGNSKRGGGMVTGNSIMRENRRRRAELKDPSKIFVGNLAWNTTREDLFDFCSSYGDVAHVKILRNPITKKSKVYNKDTRKDNAS